RIRLPGHVESPPAYRSRARHRRGPAAGRARRPARSLLAMTAPSPGGAAAVESALVLARRIPFPLVLTLLAGVVVAVPVLGARPAVADPPPPRPNIVVVNTDDQRFDSLGNCLPSFGAPDGPDAVACMPNVRS